MFSSRRAAYLFFTLFAIFIVSRVATLWFAGSLWFDEAFSAHIASLPWSQARELLAYEHNPWLHFLVLKFAIGVGGDVDWVLRLPSLIAGLISLPLLYWTAKKMLANDRAALISCALFTLSTMQLYHQTEARMYAFVTLFSIALLGLFYARPRYWLGMYSITALLLTHTHLTAWIFLVALYAIGWLELRHEQKSTRNWHLIHAGVLATGLIWLIPVIIHRLGVGGASQGWFFSQHEAGFFFTHLVNFLINGESRLPLRSIAAFLIATTVSVAFLTIDRPTWWQKIRHIFDQQSWPVSLNVQWSRPLRILLLLLLINLLAGFALQITVTKYLLTASVPLFLLMGYGLSRLPSKVAVGMMLGFLLLAAPTHLQLLQKRHHWDDVAKDVSAWQQQYPDQVTIVHSFAYALPLRRYLSESALHPFYPQNDITLDQAIVRHNWMPVITPDNVSEAEVLIGDHAYVILISSTNGANETDPLKAYFWQSGLKLVERKGYGGYGDPELLIFRR